MATTQFNVNSPILPTLEDFAHLYLTSPNQSPEQVDRDLMYNASRGRSYLMSAWDKLGMKKSPVDFFSDPATRAAYLGSPAAPAAGGSTSSPSGQASDQSAIRVPGYPVDPLAKAWPTFATDSERNIAIAQGHFQPQYRNPLAMTESLAMEARRKLDLEQVKQYQAQTFGGVSPEYDPNIPFDPHSGLPTVGRPEDYLTNRAALLRSQLAGDSTGTVANILRSRQGQDVNTAGGAMTPYLPNPEGHNLLDPLDMEIYNHPEFKKVMRTDPNQAAFIYQRLTGRPLLDSGGKQQGGQVGINTEGDLTGTGDYNRSLRYQNERAKVGQTQLDTLRQKEIDRQYDLSNEPEKIAVSYAKEQLRNGGGIYDPIRDKFTVTELTPPDPNQLSIGQAPRPSIQFRDANDEEERMLRRGFPIVTGRPLSQAPKAIPALDENVKQTVEKDPNARAYIDKVEQAAHHTLSSQERARALIQYHADQAAKNLEATRHAPGGVTGDVINSFETGLFGYKSRNKQGGVVNLRDVFGQDMSTPEEEKPQQNWWGKFLEKGYQNVPF